MIFAIIVLIIALAVATTAAWFSIVGLIAIFASSPVSIAIMASGLEAAKLVTASWLYRNWNGSPKILKYPLTAMVGVLMIITSLGIFGFLSKSHIEQGAPVGNNVAKIERLDKKIAQEQKTVDSNQSVVLQLDNAVKTLQEYDRIRGPEGAIAVRTSQKEERANLKAIIDEAQKTIDGYEDEKFELQSTVRAFEVEVGPIKYVADMIYGPDAGATALESAVRWLIMIIIFVFDPLAVMLLIAANYSLIEYGVKLHPDEEKKRIKAKVKKKQTAQGYNDDVFEQLVDSISKPPDTEFPYQDVVEETEEDLAQQYAQGNNNTPAWDEDEERLRAIAQNGNDGLHYDYEPEEEIEETLVEMVAETIEETEKTDLAKTDDKVVDNEPRKMSGISGWLIKDNK